MNHETAGESKTQRLTSWKIVGRRPLRLRMELHPQKLHFGSGGFPADDTYQNVSWMPRSRKHSGIPDNLVSGYKQILDHHLLAKASLMNWIGLPVGFATKIKVVVCANTNQHHTTTLALQHCGPPIMNTGANA